MVRWFSPWVLLPLLVRVVVSRLAGEYADRRERLAVLPADGPYDYSMLPEIGIDYVADLGDGFNATATVAALIAAPALDIADPASNTGASGANTDAHPRSLRLEHGRILVMGGDQVYPGASRQEYLDRLEVPYYSVHPASAVDAPRDLFVLPGNHDWYDGLGAFSRLFMQQRWFAGWKTAQTRSYFVLRLPARWWFIAVDLQFDNDVDLAQRDYLLHATREMQPGDAVVLATATPFWLPERRQEHEILLRNIAYLQRILIDDRSACLRATISGDLHHYRHHREADGLHRIICGGGGAFLHGTAWQPPVGSTVSLCERNSGTTSPPVSAGGEEAASLPVCFPTPLQSRRALWPLGLFPLFNPELSALLAAALLLFGWGADASANGLFFAMLGQGALPASGVFLETALTSPAMFFTLVAWLVAAIVFTDPPPYWPVFWAGIARIAVGTVLAFGLLGIALQVFLAVMPNRLVDPLDFLVAMLRAFGGLWLVAGAFFGLWLFALYQLGGFHRDVVFAACRIEDYKSFLRLRIHPQGELEVCALGITRVCRRWRERQPVAAGEALVEPADGVALSRRAKLVDRFRLRAAES